MCAASDINVGLSVGGGEGGVLFRLGTIDLDQFFQAGCHPILGKTVRILHLESLSPTAWLPEENELNICLIKQPSPRTQSLSKHTLFE